MSLGRVIASAWSRDGSRLYMRAAEFRGHDREPAELLYVGHQVRGCVQLHQVVTLSPPCNCGMCSIMERVLDEEYGVKRPNGYVYEDELGDEHVDREDCE